MNNNKIILTIIAVIMVSALAFFLFQKEKKKRYTEQAINTDSEYREEVQQAEAKGEAIPPPPRPKPAGISIEQWNDPTYVMAQRISDSFSWTQTPNERTATWKALASKSDDFIKHTNNWFNGHFGLGKTIRQFIEETWYGDKNVILPRLSQIGL